MPTKGVVDIYDGQIADMRRAGNPLQVIGDVTGVSRERIRQVLKKRYPDVRNETLNELALAALVGYSEAKIANLRRAGKLHPRRVGWRWIYDASEVAKAKELLAPRICQHCGLDFIHPPKNKYCDACSAIYPRNTYPFKTEEGKRKQNEATGSWQKRHPERYGIIRARALRKYQAKKRVENLTQNWYLITKRCQLPKGTAAKAVDFKRAIIIFEGGIEIPVVCTKIVRMYQKEVSDSV